DTATALLENRRRRRDHDARREFEHLTAVHLDERIGVLETPRAAARKPEVLSARTVGAELEPEEPATGDRLHDDGAGSVAEEYERRAIAPIEDLREYVAADDERSPGQPPGEHPVRLCDRVHEPRAAGEQVVRTCVLGPELVRQDRRGCRKHHV